jgi:hypothetical protein
MFYKSWLLAEKIAAIALIFTILSFVAAILVIPEFRRFVGLEETPTLTSRPDSLRYYQELTSELGKIKREKIRDEKAIEKLTQELQQLQAALSKTEKRPVSIMPTPKKPTDSKSNFNGREPLFPRSTSKSDLSEFEMKPMLIKMNFFDKRMNENGDGFPNDFELGKDKQLVIDNATHLMWQKSGSEYRMSHDQAQAYIGSLKIARFAGYSDWRLPTLEEAMSLMEASKRKDDLYIDPVFDHQWAIWTSDKTASSEAWMVSFDRGSCTYKSIDCYVRAVRVQ